MVSETLAIVLIIISGLCPLSFLLGLSVGVIWYFQNRRQEYDTQTIVGIQPSKIPSIATAMLQAGWDVFTVHDEQVGLVNLVAKKRRTL